MSWSSEPVRIGLPKAAVRDLSGGGTAGHSRRPERHPPEARRRSRTVPRARSVLAFLAAACLIFIWATPIFAGEENPPADLEHPEKGRPEDGVSWYFAEGCTRPGFEEWLILFNPGEEEALVDVEYVVERGINRTRYYNLPPRSRLNVYVNQEVGSGHDLGLVASSERFFLAERSIYFNYRGVWKGGYSSSGAPSPSSEWYFAEGGAGADRDCWLSLLNPLETDCEARVFLVREGGENIALPLVLPGKRRVTVNLGEAAGSWRDFFIMVMADGPVVAERQQFFSYVSPRKKGPSCAGGFSSAGATSPSEELYLASVGALPDRDTWLVAANPDIADARIDVQLLFGPGDVRETTLWLGGLSRQAFDLALLAGGEGECSVLLRSDRPLLCEAVTYFDLGGDMNGGSCVTASVECGRRWYVVDLGDGGESHPWLELANFGEEPAAVAVFLYLEGRIERLTLTVEPKGRSSLAVEGPVPPESSSSCEILCDRDILAQKSFYFIYHGLWGGGDASMATQAP